MKGDDEFEKYNREMFHNVYFQQMNENQSKEYLEALLTKNRSLNKHTQTRCNNR